MFDVDRCVSLQVRYRWYWLS